MKFGDRAYQFLKNRKLVVNALAELMEDLNETYRQLPTALGSQPETAWIDLSAEWKSFAHNNNGFVQLYRSSWPNEGQAGVHLEIGHSVETVLRGVVGLVLHVERHVQGNPKLWPRLGEEVLNCLARKTAPGVWVATDLPKGDTVTLASTDIAIDMRWDAFVANIGAAPAKFKHVADAVDEGLWRCTHRPLFRTGFGQDEPIPELRWGESHSTGGQSIVSGGGRGGSRCLVISDTRMQDNHDRRCAILSCGHHGPWGAGARPPSPSARVGLRQAEDQHVGRVGQACLRD